MNDLLITVFTPTYNRSKTLIRLCNSLKKQTYCNFEWIIINDGSTDNTDEIVNHILNSEMDFNVVYKKVKNGGKHRAINSGIKLAKGELFFIVDSDDWLPENSLETIVKFYNQIRFDKKYAGVAGCKYDSMSNLSGTTFSGEYVDATSLERKKYNIKGEKAEVFRTEIIKKYPFPEYQGETFISEAIVWDKIAFDGYLLRWFNENVYIFEYQKDGITNNLRENYAKNPKGYLDYIYNEMVYQNIYGVKKYIWCGRCINTVKNVLEKQEIAKRLRINNKTFWISKLVYSLYALFR